MTEAVCKHCGKTEDQHCIQFEKKMPDGCQCSPGEWGPDVEPICSAYEGDRLYRCAKCEHDFACHPSAPTLNSTKA